MYFWDYTQHPRNSFYMIRLPTLNLNYFELVVTFIHYFLPSILILYNNLYPLPHLVLLFICWKIMRFISRPHPMTSLFAQEGNKIKSAAGARYVLCTCTSCNTQHERRYEMIADAKNRVFDEQQTLFMKNSKYEKNQH